LRSQKLNRLEIGEIDQIRNSNLDLCSCLLKIHNKKYLLHTREYILFQLLIKVEKSQVIMKANILRSIFCETFQ